MPKTYKVGPRPVLGHEPEATFTADLDPVQEARLVQGRALTIVNGAEGDAPPTSPSSPSLPPDQLTELKGMSYEDLVDLATDLGVPDADGLKSKQAAIDAIAAHAGGSTKGDTPHG